MAKRKKKGKKLKPGSLAGGKNQPFKGKRGSGTRFKNCKKKIKAKDKDAACAAIMYAKYGKNAKKKLKRK